MAATYKDNGGSVNGSNKVFTYDFPVLQTEDIKVALNGVTQATTKYTASLSPANITFNNTSVDSTVQESDGSPKSGVTVRVYRETTVGKNTGDEDPKAVFAAGSSIRAGDLNANTEQALFGIHELQEQPFLSDDIEDGAVTTAKIAADAITGAKIADDQINSEHYVDGSIDAAHIGNFQITTDKISGDAVTGIKIADNAIDSEHYAADSIDSEHYAPGSVDSTALGTNAVTTDKIADDNVTLAKLGSGALPTDITVASANIVNGTIVDADISSGAGISHTKLSGMSAGNVLIGNSSNVPTSTTITGDVTINSSGVTSIGSGAVGAAKIASDAITGAKIADDAIDSEHYVDGSIDSAHIGANQVTTAKIADDAITSAKLDTNIDIAGTLDVTAATTLDSTLSITGTTTAAAINASGAVNATGNLAINTNKFNVNATSGDTTIAGTLGVTGESTFSDHVNIPDAKEIKLGASDDLTIWHGTAANDGNAGITANYIDSGSQDLALQVDTEAKGVVIHKRTGNGLFDFEILAGFTAGGACQLRYDANQKLATTASGILITGQVDLDDVTGDAVITSGTSTSDTKIYSAKRAGEIFYGKDTAEEIQSGETWSAADNKVATTAAIDARIIDLVDDVGGFVPIANETSFPTSNPDVNNGTGTLVSIKAISSTRTPSGGTVTIANGAGSNTVTITGCGSTELTAGFGLIVETQGTLHTYAFHRLVPKATEVTTVAGSISNVNTVAGSISNVNTVAGNNSNVTTVAGVSGNVTTVAGISSNVTTVAGISSDVTAVAGDATDIGAVAAKATEIGRLGTADAVADMNTLGTNAIVSDLDTCATNVSNINTTAGSIANVNTVASNIGTVNDFAARYRTGANNPTDSLDTGDLFFNTSANELKVYNGSAWQGGVTASGSFASVTGNTFTGDNLYNDSVKAKFGTGSDLEIYHNGSNSRIVNTHASQFSIGSDITAFTNAAVSEDLAKFTANGSAELYYDAVKKFHTHTGGVTVTGYIQMDGTEGSAAAGNIYVEDDGIIKLGDGGDLQLYHDGTHSFIKDTGTGSLKICSNSLSFRNAADGEDVALFVEDGSSELYYDNVKKFYTQSVGARVEGRLYVTDYIDLRESLYLVDNKKVVVGSGSDLQLYHDGTYSYIKNSNANGLWVGSDLIALTNNAVSETLAKFTANGSAELYYDAVKKFHTTTSGAQLTGDLFMDDSYKLKLGTSQDLQIYHDGTDARIYNSTGSLIFRSDTYTLNNAAGNENILKGTADGAVELYHNSVKTFETNDSGIKVFGPEGGSSFIYIHADEGDDNADKYHLQVDQDGTGFYIKNEVSGSTEVNLRALGNNTTELYYDNSKKIQTTSGGIEVTGNITVSSTTPKIFLTDTDTNDDFSINGDGGNFRIRSETDSADRFVIDSNGTASIGGNLDVGTGVDVTGNITVTGTVDGRDVATDGTKLDGIEASATADQTAAEILTAIKTVDGNGSGLDADMLEGYHASFSNTGNTVAIRDGSGDITLRDVKGRWYQGEAGRTDTAMSSTNIDAGGGFVVSHENGWYYHQSPASARSLLNVADGANNYSHPSHDGDDIDVDTGALSGATVVSDIDINVTTDGSGHVTDANGSISTRTLTLANLGYTGATNANYITNNSQLTNGAGYVTSAGATSFSGLSDYATGTWTPVPNEGSGHSGAYGYYVRTGAVVQCWGYIDDIDESSSNAMRINGLPYNANGTVATGAVMTEYNGDSDQNLACFINNGQNYFYVYKSDSGSWSALTYHDQGGSNTWYWYLSYRI